MGNHNVLCGLDSFNDFFNSSNDSGASNETKFLSKYVVGKKLGEGGYASVYLCIRQSDGRQFAVKTGRRADMKKEDVNNFIVEFRMMSSLDHPNIIKVIELFDEKEYI